MKKFLLISAIALSVLLFSNSHVQEALNKGPDPDLSPILTALNKGSEPDFSPQRT